MNKQELLALADRQQDRLKAMSDAIFDHPEVDGQEYFAADLLTKDLQEQGFMVERNICGLETAFRATWQQGEGGPNIGILGEYDALAVRGHGCGHHMQTPSAIGAAVAIKDYFSGTGIPFTITLYGTPAEETFGGKITMVKNGAFRELNVALSTHANSSAGGGVNGGSIGLRSFSIDFHGKSAHAAGSPWNGRSATDAMILCFHGIEFMREHIKDGTRIHYAVQEGTGAANIVPDLAKATVTLRSYDQDYLRELEQWLAQVVQGACLMTRTTADILLKSDYASLKPNQVLADLAKANFVEQQIPLRQIYALKGGGATDFANVSLVVPSVLVSIPFTQDGSAHSQQWVDAGKGPQALSCLMDSARMLAGIIHDLIVNPRLLDQAAAEFNQKQH